MNQEAKLLVDCGYARVAGQFPDDPSASYNDFWCVSKVVDNGERDWISVDPYSNHREGRKQLDALIARFGINRIIEFDVSGWSVECFTLRSPTQLEMKQYGREKSASDFCNGDVKTNRIMVCKPERFKPEHVHEAESLCLKKCCENHD